jgi:hypothetical protein
VGTQIYESCYPIEKTKPEIEISTDASSQGYGALCANIKAGGRWS